MSNEEHPRLQQFPYISNTLSTRGQFLDMMNSFLENNDISVIGPSTIQIQQTEDAGMPISKPFLSLTCEIRYPIIHAIRYLIHPCRNALTNDICLQIRRSIRRQSRVKRKATHHRWLI